MRIRSCMSVRAFQCIVPLWILSLYTHEVLLIRFWWSTLTVNLKSGIKWISEALKMTSGIFWSKSTSLFMTLTDDIWSSRQLLRLLTIAGSERNYADTLHLEFEWGRILKTGAWKHLEEIIGIKKQWLCLCICKGRERKNLKLCFKCTVPAAQCPQSSSRATQIRWLLEPRQYIEREKKEPGKLNKDPATHSIQKRPEREKGRVKKKKTRKDAPHQP